MMVHGRFYINQRVIVNGEIGTVQLGPTMVNFGGPPDPMPKKGHYWVHLPSKGHASCFSEHNVFPLPNGQL